MMRNRDLMAYLKPVKSRLGPPTSVEWIDLTGQVMDVRATAHRLQLGLDLPAGLFRMYLRTQAGAFDMATAGVEMVRVPDGRRVMVGPWDLDHVHNVMALPMARVWVNGALKGGLWFAMPGPEEIAEGRLFADFSFEASAGKNEVVLELVERDRERMGWDRVEFAELRIDDRRLLPLVPRSDNRPRLFATVAELEERSQRWAGSPEFDALQTSLRTDELRMLTDNSQGTLSVAMLVYALTGDAIVGSKAREAMMQLAHAETWSGRPDPLLMGGENDRGISLRLFHVALAWEYLQPLLTESDRSALLAKAEEYLRKMYDFTLLQRAYMGYPAIDPHSLGSWNGTGIACMAFYDELEIARKALPFFHGLFVDSLALFPESGKAAWATYFPFHIVLYFAAASTFAGPLDEVAESGFLRHLGDALLSSFSAPNPQELQRGLRTREHRFLTAFLCRFCPTPGIGSTYRAFLERERQTAGDVSLGLFDLLYAPPWEGPRAAMSQAPLYAEDVGDVIVASDGEPRVSVSMSAGAKSGRRASFTLMPQNREFAPSMGAFEVSVDGASVLCNLNISSYGIFSALTNTMCFEDGGGVTDGQYLNGAVRPDQCGVMRRYLCGERIVYAHVDITHALDPKLEVDSAERIFVFDRRTGAIVIADSFSSRRPLRFATHLHCSGKASQLQDGMYRLTGGQAELIAGIKGGSKGLSNDERGELFANVLRTSASSRVVMTEPTWIPGYIYGLNLTGKESLEDARYPRYTRWRLEVEEPLSAAELFFGLSPRDGMIRAEGDLIRVPQGGLQFGPGPLQKDGFVCEGEALVWDEVGGELMALGVTRIEHEGRTIHFERPVDVQYVVEAELGRVYATSDVAMSLDSFKAESWKADAHGRSHGKMYADFVALDRDDRGVKA